MSALAKEVSVGRLPYSCPEEVPVSLRHRFIKNDGTLISQGEYEMFEELWKKKSFSPASSSRGSEKYWDGKPKHKDPGF